MKSSHHDPNFAFTYVLDKFQSVRILLDFSSILQSENTLVQSCESIKTVRNIEALLLGFIYYYIQRHLRETKFLLTVFLNQVADSCLELIMANSFPKLVYSQQCFSNSQQCNYPPHKTIHHPQLKYSKNCWPHIKIISLIVVLVTNRSACIAAN